MKIRIPKEGIDCGCGCGIHIPERKPSGAVRYSRSQDGKFYVNGHNPVPKGPQHHGWKGGMTINSTGYRLILRPDHPKADRDGYVREHLLVWEEANGPLPSDNEIHHINGNRSDNRLENLIALTISAHHRNHVLANGGIPSTHQQRSDGGKKGAASRWHKSVPYVVAATKAPVPWKS